MRWNRSRGAGAIWFSLLLAVTAGAWGAGLAAAPPYAQTEADWAQGLARVAARLEPEIRRAMMEGQIPSFVLALTDREGELWAGAYGESNLWADTPASTRTVYLIGSTFKAQSTVALLQQMEAGKFALDDRVNDYLDEFQIRGEDPAHPVTFRHLLTHTSGLPTDYGGYDVWGPSVPPPLAEYLADTLVLTRPTGERAVYSNMAFTLVAYLVEKLSGVPFRDYIQEHVWDPLGMTSTAFQPTPEMEERLSHPYVVDRVTGRPVPARRTKAKVWPAGVVYGTVHDQAAWVRFNLGDGGVGDRPPGGGARRAPRSGVQRLLQAETMEAMHTLQYPDLAGRSMAGGWGYEDPGYGLTWWLTTRGGEHFFGHSGSVSGYTAFIMGNRTRGFGIAVLTNGDSAHPHLVRICNLALDLLAQELGESR
jgi:CubicO group peptidase (beta-lactamase class C family)